jgi:ATP-dependent helicase/nuclease subunit A
MSGAVYELKGEQRDAVDPQDSVWLSASAGTGKTQVLSARVLRLLLEPDVAPSDILCLTFTKAGAAEMSLRVNDVLARWVRMPAGDLARELGFLGAPVGEETRARARSLFANVLDCPGGGLRIDTIHAFAQYLLAAFPQEAGIAPGATAMEDRERALLLDEVLGDMLGEAEASNDTQTLAAIAEISRTKGEDEVRKWLMRCAGSLDLWDGPDGWQAPMLPRVRAVLGVPADADEAWAAELLSDDAFPMSAVRSALAAVDGWKAQIADKTREFLTSWIAQDAAGRLVHVDGFCDTLLKKDGEPRSMKGAAKNDPSFPEYQAQVVQAYAAVSERLVLLSLADYLTQQLELGRRFALLWNDAKARKGLVDFDDQIRRAAALLTQSDFAPWIRYKLDRNFDHILVDEAQDTNPAQWAIINALSDDFFAGEGARGDINRTIFTVGDYKQAIFGFQGTSPENFADAQRKVARAMAAMVEASKGLRGAREMRELLDLDLGRSFRTANCVLKFVDRALAEIGHDNLGLDKPSAPHVGEKRPGLVTLWNVVADGTAAGGEGEASSSSGDAFEDSDDKADGADTESWLDPHDRQLADRIALQVKAWMEGGFPLVKGVEEGKARRATPGDVMILVRKRKALAGLIVARLYNYGVPVAGVDRLRLGAPLAVKDLMAALRFAAQPLDDLNLANLLVSPLMGWSQQDLLDHGYRQPEKLGEDGRGKIIPLWEHLRDSETPLVQQSVLQLLEILRRADFEPPQAMLHWLLTGPFDGRRRLIARLGAEANDPIDELLNAANAYASGNIASLQGFIRWFDAGDAELKREASEPRDEVRVMTVHGSKGLQAPIVILADAALGPDKPGNLSLEQPQIGSADTKPAKVPLPDLSGDMRAGPVAEAYDKALAVETQEHWRLLYVAMTRAEEALFITGSLGKQDTKRGLPPEDSWFAKLQPLFDGEAFVDPIWDARWEWGRLSQAPFLDDAQADEAVEELPQWLNDKAPDEPRPPKPLAPSGLGEQEGSDPPIDMPSKEANAANEAALAMAARRGVLIHALLERLPDVRHEARAERGQKWLETQAPDLSEDDRQEMLGNALRVLDDPQFAHVFGAEALAEIPLAAVVGGQVITGIADRLLVTKDTVTVVDFKTARRPPASLDEIPESVLKQMAAYVAALGAIYPSLAINAAVLYTQTPQLFALPAAMLEGYKARFQDQQESFVLPAIE